MDAALLEAAFKLPADLRRELADRLYASLGDSDDGFALSPEQDAELSRREARLEQIGPTGEEWDAVKQRLLSGRRS